jgi:hypothetical protein
MDHTAVGLVSCIQENSIMNRVVALLAVVASLAALPAAPTTSSRPAADDAGAAVAAGRLPPDYRDWRLISVAREEGELDDIRAVLGNDPAIDAYRQGTSPFPDGTVIARLAWSYESSKENDEAFRRKQSFVAGHPKNGVQFMVKDATRYASTGGWLYAQFDDGQPLRDDAQLQSCFQCHKAVHDRDYVFTRYAR